MASDRTVSFSDGTGRPARDAFFRAMPIERLLRHAAEHIDMRRRPDPALVLALEDRADSLTKR